MNKVLLVGYVVGEVETKVSQSGLDILDFKIETKEEFTGKDGDSKESSEIHNIQLFGKKANLFEPLLTQGTLVEVDGKLKMNTWKGQAGKEFSSARVNVFTIRIIDSSNTTPMDKIETTQPEVDDLPF